MSEDEPRPRPKPSRDISEEESRANFLRQLCDWAEPGALRLIRDGVDIGPLIPPVLPKRRIPWFRAKR